MLWSIIYGVINIKLKKINIKKVIIQIIKGPYHIWYLYAIIGLYIIIPFTRQISKNSDLLKSFIILNFIILFIIPNYIYLLSYYSLEVYKLLNYIYSNLNLYTLSLNNFYFIFGYYLNNKEMKNEYKIIIYILGLIGILLTTEISYYLSFKKKKKIIHFHPKYFNIFLLL